MWETDYGAQGSREAGCGLEEGTGRHSLPRIEREQTETRFEEERFRSMYKCNAEVELEQKQESWKSVGRRTEMFGRVVTWLANGRVPDTSRHNLGFFLSTSSSGFQL
jgi:hypothetical protein